MNLPIFSTLPSQTQSNLATISTAVMDVFPTDVCSWIIDITQLPSEPSASLLVQKISVWAGKSKTCLYFFVCISPNINIGKIEKAFYNAKARETNNRAFPRFNSYYRKNPELGAIGKCFYVGGSQSIVKRLKDHLGYGTRSTYALQLIHWAQPLSLQLEFVCAKYPENTPTEVIQALEDTLWGIKVPIFGRQGRK